MTRSTGGMWSSRCCVALVALHMLARTSAGPLGPLPNITSSDLGLKEDSCAVGDLVYQHGDSFPGAGPCERCACERGGVRCAQQTCEPRPGCKALHRPDHCCPTYQCECEQAGRVYGNGEKLVDPADPCRVCYCQGGEVVCRRIACFQRDDCSPRPVPGRCCPEYDNCPLRGVTALPGLSSSLPSMATIEHAKPSAIPFLPKEISIKEITPVSEIPVITDVKIKEILPSPSIEVSEYSSSKSPLIPREATTEKNFNSDPEPEVPSVIEVLPSPEAPAIAEVKTDNDKEIDSTPSKINLSTQDSINTDIYPSHSPMMSLMGVPPVVPDSMPTAGTTKAPIIEEEDPSLFSDHNPAFPPLPDDLSVLSNHGDEIVPEPSADSDHLPGQEIIVSSSTESEIKEPLTTTPKYIETTLTTTEKASDATTEPTTPKLETVVTESASPKESPMLNLRFAIPTEILTAPSEEITDLEATHDLNTTEDPVTVVLTTTTTTETPTKSADLVTEKAEVSPETELNSEGTTTAPELETSTPKTTVASETDASTKDSQEQTTSSIAKSNIATEVTSQTELSSLPIETSDQNPHEVIENISKETEDSSTEDPITTSVKFPVTSEVITVSKINDNGGNDNIETTEFLLTSSGSSESATDTVELIKISGDTQKSEAIVDGSMNKNNALRDLIKLVNDVASINDRTENGPAAPHVASTSISDSEELIPVNAGYKSKNSNFNVNSITEVPLKSKNATPGNKQKVVEIEDDDTDNITDAPPPNDKVEPTTRRPIIDNVSDDNMPDVKTDKKDIEIITQSYVPTINRRPTKVVLEELPAADAPAGSAEAGTESGASAESATADPLQ